MITQEFIKQNFPKGKLTLFGGRPAMGKTSLLTSPALNLALAGKYSFYLSLEMNNAKLVNRIKSQCETISNDSLDKISRRLRFRLSQIMIIALIGFLSRNRARGEERWRRRCR